MKNMKLHLLLLPILAAMTLVAAVGAVAACGAPDRQAAIDTEPTATAAAADSNMCVPGQSSSACINNGTCACAGGPSCGSQCQTQCNNQPTPPNTVDFSIPVSPGFIGYYDLGVGDKTFPFGACADAYWCVPTTIQTPDYAGYVVYNDNDPGNPAPSASHHWMVEVFDIAGSGGGSTQGAQINVRCTRGAYDVVNQTFIQLVKATVAAGGGQSCTHITNDLTAQPALMGRFGISGGSQNNFNIQQNGSYWDVCTTSFAGATYGSTAWAGALVTHVTPNWGALTESTNSTPVRLSSNPNAFCALWGDSSPYTKIDRGGTGGTPQIEPDSSPFYSWARCAQ